MLSQMPAKQRGDRVRVVQQYESADQPPEAQAVYADTLIIVTPPLHTPHYHHHRSSGGGLRLKSQADAKADEAWWWIVAAAGAAVGLAATEGRRFNGWVRMHPMHPIHLYGPAGQYTSVPLAQLSPSTAEWAVRAVVRDKEGPWERIKRAPLERVGWSYSVLLGAAEFPSQTGDKDVGFLAHIQTGYFPQQQLGVLFDIGLGWNTNRVDETVFDSRYAAEVQFMPVAAGRVHAGGFGQLGLAARFERGGNRRSSLFGAGALLQIDITTYLAFTARAGFVRVHDEFASDLTVGISVY